MELQEFIEAFLPDYKRKKKNFRFKGVSFSDKYFPEALQNFADRICKNQRMLCFKKTKKAMASLNFPYFEGSIYNGTIEAEQPEIELLTPDE